MCTGFISVCTGFIIIRLEYISKQVFKNFSVLNSNMVNINRYNPHKQNSLRPSIILKSRNRSSDQKVWEMPV